MKNSNKRHPKKHRLSVALVVVIAVTVAIFAAIACGAAFLKMYRPSVDTDVPFPIETTLPPDQPKNPSETTAEDEPKEDPYVRDTETVNFLVVGRDKSSWNTDVLMIVNFNMREGSLSILQIPRDTYIRSEEITGRINAGLAMIRNDNRAENPKLSQSELLRESMADMTELLERSLCIQIDGYVHVDLAGFRSIINTIGGVWMDVPYAMDYEDPFQDLNIHLEPGPQLLDGEKAEMFVRFRSGFVQADIGRMDAQKIFMAALFKQMKSNLTLSKIPALMEDMFKYVTTDVPLADIIIYAKELIGVDMAKISMMTLHGTAQQTNTGAWYYIMNRAAALQAVNAHFNVYNREITDALFDPNAAFTDPNVEVFSKIYHADPNDEVVQVKPDEKTGEDINNGGINIPLN